MLTNPSGRSSSIEHYAQMHYSWNSPEGFNYLQRIHEFMKNKPAIFHDLIKSDQILELSEDSDQIEASLKVVLKNSNIRRDIYIRKRENTWVHLFRNKSRNRI